ncbi:MAG: preprotein translocase subunit SecG [Chloroflexi bacterium RBG_13_52_14]|jgi:preprotein translocase subunit SecG|nr:MAG: preprotein translocase subunit SecG [Chloroflexi bacterium RBG_13_52_14]
MTLIQIALIVIAVMLTVVVLAQVRGGGMSGIFGGGGESAFRTRRGLERTLFRFTIVLIVVFIALCIVSVRFE